MSQILTHTGKRFDLPEPNANTSLDAQETKSLCCAAAGITAPLSTTAEARIPHKKLRGAALTDAELNAQVRPPAQPVVGYTRSVQLATDQADCPRLQWRASNGQQ
jgi:hypothetical protein